MFKRSWLTVLVLVAVLALGFGVTSAFARGGGESNGDLGAIEGYCVGEETMEEMMGDYDHTSGCGEDALDGMGGGGMMGGGMMGGGMMGNW